MRIEKVCVLGGSGFVGTSIVNRLDMAGYQVKVLTRRREKAKHLILLPRVNVVECDVMDDVALAQEIAEADAVINLVGILHQSRNATFEAIHGQWPRRLVQICRNSGVQRLLHMSALHASETAPSQYLRTKAAGEAEVMKEALHAEPILLRHGYQLQVTAFRPSVIFGRGDHFLNLFAKLVRFLPVIFLAKPATRFQPVWVEDVAQAFVNSLQNIDTFGKSYDLCGPKVYSLRELVQLVADTIGVKRRIIGLNDRLSYLQAYAMEWLPVKLMTRDNLYSMQIDSVCNAGFPVVFGIQPTAVEAVIPDYLTNRSVRNTYNRYRGHAGR
ncbi:MAG TPA: complex I NDUFA9 subunit family protein [Methylophilaceae bacterium]|nr:complex I NDUFA9 subunit family protein [Methylophilaceae bacterium]